jgi:hypothetical protein
MPCDIVTSEYFIDTSDLLFLSWCSSAKESTNMGAKFVSFHHGVECLFNLLLAH